MREIDRIGRCAAALQCIAEEFREHAALGFGVRDGELQRFAGVLDHMAASLMVASPTPSAQVLKLPPPSERKRLNHAASPH